MVYFDDRETKVIKEMIKYYDDCGEMTVPRSCAELIGAIRLKFDSEINLADACESFEESESE